LKKFALRYSASAVAIAVLALEPAHAQQTEVVPRTEADAAADTGQSDGLGEILVTARRVTENLQDVPVAVTALSGDALKQKNIGQVSDLQFSVPNLQIKPSTIYPSQVEFIIRGQRQNLFTDENVVTYVNGVPQDTRGLSLYDMESVQALKGPQGTLFGKNSIGGAMVFTTTRPKHDFGGSLEMEYGNYNLMKANAVINAPISDAVALRLAGEIERRDGVFKNTYPGMGDLGDRENESFRASLLIEPSSRFENLLTVDFKQRNEIPFPAIIEAAPLNATGFAGLVSILTTQVVQQQSALGGSNAVVDGNLLVRQGNPFITRAFTGVGNAYPPMASLSGPGTIDPINTYGSEVRTWSVANNTTFELNDNISIKNIFGYSNIKAFDHSDPSGLSAYTPNASLFYNCLFDPTGNCNAGIPGPIPALLSNNNVNYYNGKKSVSNEVQFIGKFDNFDFIGGLFYSKTDLLYSVNSFFTIGGLSLYDNPATLNQTEDARHAQAKIGTDSYAVFAQGTYDFSGMGVEGLRLTLGARYTWVKTDIFNENFFTDSNAQLITFAEANEVQANCNQLNGTSGQITSVNDGTNCYLSGKKTDKAPTWTASLEYKLGRDTLAYLATRRGWKAGGANPTTRSQDFAFFGPEKITDYELGLKHQGYLGSIPFRLNVAGFIGKYKDIQTQNIITFYVDSVNGPTSPTPGTYTDLIIFNTSSATIKGVELEASVKPVRDLTLDLGFSHQVGKYGKGSVQPQPQDPTDFVWNGNPIDTSSGVSLGGAHFAGVPKTTLNASVIYAPSWVPESFAKPVISVNYSWRSNTPGNTPQGIYPWPSYGLWGSRVSLNEIGGTPVSLSFWMQNIADKTYKIYCADNLYSIGYAACRFGEPRTYGAALSFKW